MYDQAYFDKYKGYEDSPVGKAVNDSRVLLTTSFVDDFSSFVDVGIGCGTFVNSVGCLGTDTNPVALKWLADRGKLYQGESCDYMSFWDVLEHIHYPTPILFSIRKGVFISMPIYRDLDHVLASKHFRPSEHCWYFTDSGLKTFMKDYDFECVAESDNETKAGREDIKQYYFKKKGVIL